MFCTKCGKKIDYEALVCNECLAAEAKAADAQVSGDENNAPESNVNDAYTSEIKVDTSYAPEDDLGDVYNDRNQNNANNFYGAPNNANNGYPNNMNNGYPNNMNNGYPNNMNNGYGAPNNMNNGYPNNMNNGYGMPNYDPNYDPNFYAGNPNPAPNNPPAPQGSRMEGFGRALTSTILGFVGYIVAAIAMGMLAAATEMEAAGAMAAGMFFMFGAIALCVVSLILGIKSIKTFRTAAVKPIATLILGITGLVFACIGFFIVLMALLVCVSIVSLL